MPSILLVRSLRKSVRKKRKSKMMKGSQLNKLKISHPVNLVVSIVDFRKCWNEIKNGSKITTPVSSHSTAPRISRRLSLKRLEPNLRRR